MKNLIWMIWIYIGAFTALLFVAALISSEFKQDHWRLIEPCELGEHKFDETRFHSFSNKWDREKTLRVNGIFECKKCQHFCVVRFELVCCVNEIKSYVPIDTTLIK